MRASFIAGENWTVVGCEQACHVARSDQTTRRRLPKFRSPLRLPRVYERGDGDIVAHDIIDIIDREARGWAGELGERRLGRGLQRRRIIGQEEPG